MKRAQKNAPARHRVLTDNCNKVDTVYDRARHAAVRTDDYIFNQIIPYIGNKRRLLGLIQNALASTDLDPAVATFADLFAGSGVVSRMAKRFGYRVVANDWEPFTLPINTCAIERNTAPPFAALGGYGEAIATLNQLPPREDWVTRHLCPRDDIEYDTKVDRMFFMRKNGMRIDAIREQIADWRRDGRIDSREEACLLAPLLYQVCYTSNTSGVFKGFHNGWGGQTGTALYRIASDLTMSPAVLHDNGRENQVVATDALNVAENLSDPEQTIAYLDPPYNQHPYGSNYHVLNSIALWDKPEVTLTISRGTKSAIRTDWRTERRSAYNYGASALTAYRSLLDALQARYILTSYSTDGIIPMEDILRANTERGGVTLEVREYKRYRVSSQRYSEKPVNVEFIVVLDTHAKANGNIDELVDSIRLAENRALTDHPENGTTNLDGSTLSSG
jgi:adenine-specific DNA-methyltransferase